MIPAPSRARFEQLSGEALVLTGLEVPACLVVEEVADLPGPDGYECFTVILRGPAEFVIAQATYRFEHDGEAFDMFIVPIGADERGVRYQAVFNRRTAGEGKVE